MGVKFDDIIFHMETTNIALSWKEILLPIKVAVLVNMAILVPISLFAVYLGNPFDYIGKGRGGHLLLSVLALLSVYLASAAAYSMYKLCKSHNRSTLVSWVASIVIFVMILTMFGFGVLILAVSGAFGGFT